jgi:hypothetical protein
MMSLLHAQKIENYEWDGQARGGYCRSAIGLVELMYAFCGLSTNVTPPGSAFTLFVRR